MRPTEIGQVVQYHRKRAGLSRKELSTLSNVSPSVIYEIEHGKKTVQMNSLMNLLNALNLTLDIKGPLVKEYYDRLAKRENIND